MAFDIPSSVARAFRDRRVARRAALILTAIAIALVTFTARFNALGGSLGGFDDDEFVTLTHVDMVLDGQQPNRDFADNELRGVWPSLSFELPALVQRIWGHNLFVHACYTLSALVLCAVMVLFLSAELSRRWLPAVLAATLVILSWTVPYNYQKLLAMTLGIVAIRWAMLRPSWPRLTALAAATLSAGLFRHDYGLCVAVGAIAGLVACQPRPWIVPLRRIVTYVALFALVFLPSAVWLTWNGGIINYAAVALRSSLTQTVNNPAMAFRPRINLSAPFQTDSLLALVYYAYWAFVIGAMVVLVSRRRRPVDGHDADLGTGWALVAMTSLVNYFLLRTHLQARFGDAIVPMALIGPWMVGQAPFGTSRVARLAAFVVPQAAMALMCMAFVPIEYVPQELSTGRFLTASLSEVTQRYQQVKTELLALPPHDWKNVEARGTLVAARYLAECTAPDDDVLVGTFAEQVPYFARRHFAGGQSYFAFSFLTTEADQRLVLQRLGRQSVPVVLAPFDYDEQIVRNYPLIARHIAAHYHEVGAIDNDGEPWVRVFVENDRHPTRTDPQLGFPCFR